MQIYGEHTGDARSHTRNIVHRMLLEMNMQHECVMCGRKFTPLQEVGKRACSFHPMDSQSPLVSGREFLESAGSSRAIFDHYRCCGSYTLHPYKRDLQHEQYTSSEGCTPSEHISTRRWHTLVSHLESEHHVPFNSMINTPINSSVDSKLWLRVYPLNFAFTLYIAQHRENLPVLNTVAEQDAFLQRFLGSNSIIFRSAVHVFHENAQKRRFTLRAGKRDFILDAREAYIYMCRQFGYSANVLVNRQAHAVVQQIKQEENLNVGSQSALTRALSMVGISKLSPVSQQAEGRSTFDDPNKQSMTSFQLLQTQVFGRNLNKQTSMQHVREDLYSTDDDMVQTSKLFSGGKMVHSGNPQDTNAMTQFYMANSDMYHQPNGFIPFVVAAWMEAEPLENPTLEPHLHEHCNITTDFLSFPSWI